MNDRSVIGGLTRKLGGSESIALAIGASQPSVQMWSKLGRIPWKWRYRVRRIVRRRRRGLTPAEWEVLALEPADVS